MTVAHDPLDTLASMAPTAVDDARLEHAAALLRARQDGDTPLSPAHPRSRVAGLGIAVALLVPGLGIGAAAAAGLIPESIAHSIAFWDSPSTPQEVRVDPASATRVASTPYDADHDFTVWSSTSPSGASCYAAFIEETATVTGAEPVVTEDFGGGCHAAGGLDEFFGNYAAGGEQGGVTGLYVGAGDAASATITLPDGTSREMLAAAGYFFGWIPGGSDSATVTGYSDARDLVGTATIEVPSAR